MAHRAVGPEQPSASRVCCVWHLPEPGPIHGLGRPGNTRIGCAFVLCGFGGGRIQLQCACLAVSAGVREWPAEEQVW